MTKIQCRIHVMSYVGVGIYNINLICSFCKMAAKGELPLIDPDAEELVFKLRLYSIPRREAITLLMPTIVAMGFMLNTVSMCTFILYQFIANCTVLYGYKISYKIGY